MASQAGAVPAKLGCRRLKPNRISMSVAYSLLTVRDNATPYYNLLEILKLENIYKLKIALFTHKITSGQANFPAIFSRSLTLASEVHSYNTRYVTSLNFYRPRVNNNYGAATFSFVASKLWETIPSDLKILSNTHFYKQYKLYLLNAQSVS